MRKPESGFPKYFAKCFLGQSLISASIIAHVLKSMSMGRVGVFFVEAGIFRLAPFGCESKRVDVRVHIDAEDEHSSKTTFEVEGRTVVFQT